MMMMIIIIIIIIIQRLRYDTKCYFNVRSKADMSQLNLPHWNGHKDEESQALLTKYKLDLQMA